MQTILTVLVLAMAIGYAAWRTYHTFRQAGNPCYGCQGCALKAQRQALKKKNAECWHKK